MPRYHFQIDNGADKIGEVDGRELANDALAVAEGGAALTEALRDDLLSGTSRSRISVTVERSDGSKLVMIKASVEIETFAQH